jgi:hypothetical protein
MRGEDSLRTSLHGRSPRPGGRAMRTSVGDRSAGASRSRSDR